MTTVKELITFLQKLPETTIVNVATTHMDIDKPYEKMIKFDPLILPTFEYSRNMEYMTWFDTEPTLNIGSDH